MQIGLDQQIKKWGGLLLVANTDATENANNWQSAWSRRKLVYKVATVFGKMFRLAFLFLVVSLLGCSDHSGVTSTRQVQLPILAPLLEAAISPDGRYSVLLASDVSVRVVDNNSGGVIAQLGRESLGNQPFLMALSSKSNVVALASPNRITLWSIADNLPLGQWQLANLGSFVEVSALAVSALGDMIAVGFNNGDMAIYRTSGELQSQYDAHLTEITHLTFLPNNQQLVSAALDGTIVNWDLNKQAQVHSFDIPFRITSFVASDNFGHLFVSDALNKQVIITLPGLEPVGELKYRERIRFFRAARFTDDQQHLVVASPKSQVSVWHTAKGKEVSRLQISAPLLSTHVLDLRFVDDQLITLNTEGLLEYWPTGLIIPAS